MAVSLLAAVAAFLLVLSLAQSRLGLTALQAAWDRRTMPLLESLELDEQAGRWYFATAFGALTAFAAGTLALGLLGGATFALLAFFLPEWLLRMRFQQRVALIDRQLPAALDALSAALRSGQSLTQAVAWVAEEGPTPIKTEFAKLSRELALGATLEDGLSRMALRVPARGLHSLVMTLEPLRSMGANLIPALQGMADVLRQRQATVEKLGTLAAQAKMQLLVMSCLLPGLTFVMFLLEPRIMLRLFADSLGHVCLALALALQAAGLILAQRFLDSKKLWS